MFPIRRHLLTECGIGVSAAAAKAEDDEESLVADVSAAAAQQHRALVFCQWKSTLDLVEQDVLKVRHVRWPGRVKRAAR